ERMNRFDARFFGIAPGEAVYIDPTQRLLLETVYQALDYGGYNGGQLAHIPTGVFISHGNSGYKELISKPDFSMAAEMGNLPAVSAGRVSHFFNLYGPSLFIDTACSSSLAALHYACESIKQGDCSMAIVGAVSVQAYYDGKTAGMDTPSGDGGEIPVDTGLPQRYRVFDKNASVGVDGEGVGVMVLKPLKQALADRDIICAVIKGTAINHNGSRTATISGQKPETQAEVILKALERANIEPGTLSYIEANGAATQMGDPIEIKTISHVMRGTTDRKEFCAVGTVKANIGHLNHASGMAGLIKTILSLREKQIPPLALFKEPNPYIDFENSPVYIPTRLRDWAVENNIPRRAGINSFSLNGTNCHIVLEEAPVLSPLSSPPHADIITISAKTEGSLKMTCRALAQYLEKNSAVPINDICYTMNTGRGRYEHRFSAVCDNRGRLVELLDNFVENGFKPDDPAVLYDHPPTGKAAAGSKTVFLFSGSKEELGQLGVDFQAKGFIAARYIDECRRWYDLETYPRARFFAFQYALAKMWMDLGVKPAFVLGFGVGKYVSKAVSGNMELEEALKQAVESRGEDTFNKEKFKTNVKLLASKGQTLFLEIGPPNELGRLIEEMSPGIPGLRVLYSYGSEDHEKTLLRSIASLYNQGTPIDFTLLFQGNKVVLPAYRFDRRRYWISGSLPGRPAQKSVSVGTAAPGTLSPDQMKQKLVQIWREFFGIDTLGVRDDFFQLGGDSLKAMSVAALIHKALHVRIPLTEFFSRPTIEGLVGFIRDTVTNRYFSLEPVEKKDYYPLSFAQKRIYILQQMSPQSTAYNMQQMGVIEGEPDPGILDRAFNRLIHRHESLRTSFHLVDQESVQRIHHHAAFKIQYHDLTANRNSGDGPGTGDVDDVVSRGIRPFDLAQAPLLRVHLIKQDHNIHILVVDMHHIVSDGISHALLLQDFMTLYKGETLEQPALQYKDFSDWQNSVKGKEMVKQQKEYWLNAYGGDIPLLNLPVDFPRPRVQSFEGRDIPFEIGVEETGGLKELAGKQGTTLYTILLAVFNILLAKISGQEDIVVGTPVAGRRHVEMEPVIGMFVNTLALRNFPDGETSFTGFLQTVKENALNAFENQDYPFEELVEEIAVNRDVSRNPLFDVMFVF
ncbi:MAG: hypothetical protein GY950_33520, partial [bacterium]|nr:hypothetical protein [bacterium]